MISAFWLLVMKVWLNLVKASVSTKMFSLLSLDGSTFKNPYTIVPGDYWQQTTPVVFVDLCNDPLQHGTNDNWWHTQLHLGSSYSNKTSLSLELMSSPIPDDHSHHVTYKAPLHDILWGAPTGVTLHHWWCKSDVEHPVLIPVNQTEASICIWPYT